MSMALEIFADFMNIVHVLCAQKNAKRRTQNQQPQRRWHSNKMLISYLKYIVNGSHRIIIDANDEQLAFSLISLGKKENRLSLGKKKRITRLSLEKENRSIAIDHG